MVSPGLMVRAVAEVLGLPPATVEWHDRILLEADLRTRGGRGSGAARLTPRDAANLITSILAGSMPKDAAESVNLYAATRPNKRQSSKKAFALAGLSELACLKAEHSFVDALEALFISGVNGDLAGWITKHSAGRKAMKPLPMIDVAASSPGAVGDIRIAGIIEGVTAQVRYMTPGPWTEPNRLASGNPHPAGPDLAQSRSITACTIVHIADLLAGRGAEP